MKKVYRVYSLSTKEVCVPSTDYYARSDDWYRDDLDILLQESSDVLNSLEEAEEFIKEMLEEPANAKTEFEIKTIHIKA